MRGPRQVLVLAVATAALVSLQGAATASAAPLQPGSAAQSTAAARAIRLGATNPDSRLGQLPVQRTYSAAVGAARRAADVHSFTDWDAAAVRAYVRAAPNGSVIGYLHEPENDIEHHTLTAAVWAQHTRELSDIILSEHRVGEVTQHATFMRWTLSPASRRAAMLNQLLTPSVLDGLRRVHGVLGWDSFAGAKSAASGPNRTPDDMYGVPARFSASKGLSWAIMETGARQERSSPDRVFAAWWQSAFDFISSSRVPSPPRFFIAWNPTDVDQGDFAVQNRPLSAAVWRRASQTFGPGA